MIIRDDYQETMCDWVGEIPKHWNMIRGRFLFNSKKEINRDLQCENLLSLTLNGVLNKDYQSSEGLRPDNYNTYQIFQKDDLVFKMIDLENVKTSRVGLVHEEGIMSPVYLRLEPIKEKINPKFSYWFYYDLYKKEIYNSIGSGVRSSLSSSDLLEIELPVPPIGEQQLISRYLVIKTKQIDSLIEKIQKKIELLKEQRTSLINQCVTKGLDPNVEMKDSGVEWIGEIPKHWVLKKVKYLGNIKSGEGVTSSQLTETGFPVYGGNGVIGYFDKSNVTSRVVVIGRVGEKCGNVHLVTEECWISDNSLILELFDSTLLKWVSKGLESTDLNRLKNQSSQPLITGTQVKSSYLPIPPKNEIESVLSRLDKLEENTTGLISLHKLQIDRLKEYRQSLISSVVTGKLRVTEDMV